ncbi:hypothetical protein GGR54DRAFT_619108 [Hypoxylon sp. NC1633]|nr:hypothetical protein GGR54DRAFT_619108 [Hypoxylon sp. NC1633]
MFLSGPIIGSGIASAWNTIAAFDVRHGWHPTECIQCCNQCAQSLVSTILAHTQGKHDMQQSSKYPIVTTEASLCSVSSGEPRFCLRNIHV